MGKKSIWIGLVALVIIAAGTFILLNNSDDKSDTTMDMPTNSASKEATNPPVSESISSNTVSIKDFKFAPADIKVKVGDVVTWTNQDSTNHTVTADTASSDAPDSPTIAPGKSYTFTFTKAGTYAYHCNFHSSMSGTVTVE